MLQQQNGRLLRRRVSRIDSKLRLQRFFVGVIDAGEVLQLTGASFLVEAFWVTGLTSSERRVHMDFNERKVALHMQGAGCVAILPVGADEAGHGDDATICKELGNLADAADVFFTVGSGKTKVLI